MEARMKWGWQVGRKRRQGGFWSWERGLDEQRMGMGGLNGEPGK